MDQALLDAVNAGDVAGVRRLLAKHPAWASARAGGVSLVRLALHRGDHETADAVVAAGADLDVFDAAALGAVRLLRISLGLEPALVEQWSSDGFQPLHLAAYFGRLDAVRLLLASGATVDEPSRNAMQVLPLHAAAASGDDDTRAAVCQELLDAGADPNARQAGGWSPLHGAAASGDERLAALLVERGADPAARADDGQTAAGVAVARGHLALGALLTVP